MLKKQILFTVILGLTTSLVAPSLSASAAEVSVAATQTGWVQESGKWYYYVNGEKQTGWIHPNDWYYMDESGAMQTGWIKLEGKWYYLAESGAMKTGWAKVDGTWYYMNKDGVMQTGWVQDGGKWYYLNDNGSMKTGWLQHTDGKYYYLNDASGEMLTNTYTPDGYYVDANGVWDGKAASNGQAIVTEALKYKGKPYVFGSTNAPNSFDCSSFTQYVFKKVTGKDITRVTTSQVNQGTYVSKSNLRAGDLVFFDNTYNGPNPTHVGIYIGNGEFIHASSGAGQITVSNLSNSYYSSHYSTARRIV